MNKQEISKLQIDLSKVNAIGQKYFDLFDKHIPTGINGNILIYDISNADCIVNIIQKNPLAKYFVYGNSYVNQAIACINETWNITFLDENFDLYNIDMKFDCIVMNPPYQRDLHLKILSEADKHKTDNGKVVCLHPSKWLQRFDYWKNKWNKFQIESAEFIDDITSRNIFPGTAIGSQLVITVLSKLGSFNYQKYSKYISWVKEKIIDKAPYLLSDKTSKFRTYTDGHEFQLNLPIIHGHIGKYDMTEITSKNYERALAVKFGKRPQDINTLKFNSETERKNFYDSTFTTFYKFLISLCRDGQTAGSCYYALPVMEDYSQPWTNERFYKFFNITSDEQKIIEETMAKYK